jgi:hypothetical protein
VTENMEKALLALLKVEEQRGTDASETVAGLAMIAGFRTGMDHNRIAHDGRVMNPAQRLIGPITQLRKQGYVEFATRRDGHSGTAYRLTPKGRGQARWVARATNA